MDLRSVIWAMPVPLAGRWRSSLWASLSSSDSGVGSISDMTVANTTTQRLVDWLLYALLLLGAAVTLIPFLYLLCSALKTRATFFASLFLPPGDGFLGIDWQGLTLEHFYVLFTDPSLGFGRAVVNSVFYASLSSVLTTLCAAMGGYALAKFAFRANRLLTALVLASLIIPGSLLLAPSYQLIYRFGLLDSFTGLILPGIDPAFGVFLFRQVSIRRSPVHSLVAGRMKGAEIEG